MQECTVCRIFYDTRKSLKDNLKLLGRAYSIRHVVRRVNRLINNNSMRVDNVTMLAIVDGLEDNTRYFRIVFDNLIAVDYFNDYILQDKRPMIKYCKI